MPELVVPSLNANDETYVLTEWLAGPADWVGSGEPVAVIETSKAASDLVAGDEGYLSQRVTAGTTCQPGDAVAWLGPTAAEARADQAAAQRSPAESAPAAYPGPADGAAAVVVTRPARELMERHGIAEKAVAALGKPVVRQSDVAALITPADHGSPSVLSPHQRAVARQVSRSHATIPAAFAVIKVLADELIRQQELVGKQARALIGIPELVIAAVAALRGAHPRCFAAVREDLSLELAERADIGVTIDVGTGLYVPVIRDAAHLGVPEISARLMDLRIRAMRRTLREEDLAGGRITLALHMDPGIVLAQPVVTPGQSCTLALCAPQHEVGLAADGTVIAYRYLHLGLAYDHRILNGRDAVAFLTSVKTALESPVSGAGS